MKKIFIYDKVYRTLCLYLQLWVVATLLAWILVSIFGYGSEGYPKEGYGGDFINGIWNNYTWGDFCFDGIAMGLLIAISMFLNALFINLFKPLQDYRGRAFIYSIVLLTVNVAASMLITKTTVWLGGGMTQNEFVNCTYMYCLVVVLVSSIHANYSFQKMYMEQQQDKHELEMKTARQEEVNLQTTLMALKTQVDPHFLFNNFSILSDMIDENPKDAKDFLGNLSRVYRFKLVNMNANLVNVEDELKMVRSYVRLLEGHYGAALHVVFPDEDSMTSMKGFALPPLAVQLAVENAVKHNARTTAHPLVVTICGSETEITVRNHISPLSSAVASTGMGIKNLKARYSLLADAMPKVENDGKAFTIHLPLIREK